MGGPVLWTLPKSTYAYCTSFQMIWIYMVGQTHAATDSPRAQVISF
jgi:hypothetical protein